CRSGRQGDRAWKCGGPREYSRQPAWGGWRATWACAENLAWERYRCEQRRWLKPGGSTIDRGPSCGLLGGGREGGVREHVGGEAIDQEGIREVVAEAAAALAAGVHHARMIAGEGNPDTWKRWRRRHLEDAVAVNRRRSASGDLAAEVHRNLASTRDGLHASGREHLGHGQIEGARDRPLDLANR